jgi:hypothetical protein
VTRSLIIAKKIQMYAKMAAHVNHYQARMETLSVIVFRDFSVHSKSNYSSQCTYLCVCVCGKGIIMLHFHSFKHICLYLGANE